MNNEDQLLTPNEVAELLLVSPITVRQWAQKGLIESLSTPGGHRRFLLQKVIEFAATKGLTLKPQAVTANQDETLRILIVEDDPQLSGFLVELLANQERHIVVETAASGFEAGSKVQSFDPNIILLDLMLPGMNGIQVCQQLKADAKTQGIRVIAMTGYYTTDNVTKIMSAGAEICLSKPLDTRKMLSVCGII